MKNLRFILPCALIGIILFFGCSKDDDTILPIYEDLPISGELIPVDHAVRLDEESSQTLVQLTPTTLIFENPTQQLKSIELGDLLVGSPSELAPNGYLRKIVTITSNGSQLTFKTEHATLDELIKECNINESFQFDWVRNKAINEPINVSLTDDGSVRLTGKFEFNPDIIFNLKKESNQLLEVKIGISMEMYKELKLSGDTDFDEEVEKEIISLKTATPVRIGGWIYIRPTFTVSAGVNGTFSSDFSVGYELEGNYVYYQEYKNGNWQKFHDYSLEPTPLPFKANADGTAEIYLNATPALTFYEFVSVETYGNTYINAAAEFSTQANEPVYCVIHGAKVGLGVQEEIFEEYGLDLTEILLFEEDLIDCQKTHSEDVYLSSQAEVDAFGNQQFRKIDGNLTIGSILSATNITDLTPLNTITEISSNLKISGNPNLVHIDGLIDLKKIGGSAWIFLNENLVDINGLANLESIGEQVHIRFNKMSNLDGLSQLSSIGQELSILGEVYLDNLDGLQSLTSIGGDLQLVDNGGFSNLDGLSQLVYVGGNLEILSNGWLNDFCGLTALIQNNGLIGTYELEGSNFSPTLQDLKNGNCKP